MLIVMWAMRLRDRSQVRAAWGVKGQQASIAKGPKREVRAGSYCPAPDTQLVNPTRRAPERTASEVAIVPLSSRSGVTWNQGGAEFLGSFVMNNMEVIQPEEKGKTKGALSVKAILPAVERRRKEGPPVIGKRKRGSESAALAIKNHVCFGNMSSTLINH